MVIVLSVANGIRLVVAVLRNCGVAILSVKLGLSAEDAFTGITVIGGGSLSNIDIASLLEMVSGPGVLTIFGSPGAYVANMDVGPVLGVVGRLGVGVKGVGLDLQVKVPPAKELLGIPWPGKRVVLV